MSETIEQSDGPFPGERPSQTTKGPGSHPAAGESPAPTYLRIELLEQRVAILEDFVQKLAGLGGRL